MNNQNYQILLGIILLVVYFTCLRKSEGFFSSKLLRSSAIGKKICFPGNRTVTGGGASLVMGDPRAAETCKGGFIRKVIAQVMTIQTYKSKKKPFRSRKRYWRTFSAANDPGWGSGPLPADKKKTDMALLKFAKAGYQSIVVYNYGKPNSKVRLNKKKIPLTKWSRNSKDGPTQGSFIQYGSTDRTLSSLRFTKNRLRECNRKLREAKSNMGAAPRQDPAFTQQAQAGSGDAW